MFYHERQNQKYGKMIKNDKKRLKEKLNRKSKVFLKISPRGSKLPQGPFLLLKNLVVKKGNFLNIFLKKIC